MEINDPRIEAYFNFELSAEETAAFLEEAKKFPAIWREIQFRQWMIDGIQDEGKIELKEFISNRLAEDREESTGKFWYAAAAIAITLVVGFGIAWPYINKEGKNTENPYAADSTFHDGAEKSEDALSTAKKGSGGTAATDSINTSIAINDAEDANIERPLEESTESKYSEAVGSDDVLAAPEIATEKSQRKTDETRIDYKRSAPAENDASTLYRSRTGNSETNLTATALLDKEVVQIASFQVVPIDPLRLKTKNVENGKQAETIAAAAVAKSKSKSPSAPQANNSYTNAPSTAADTVNSKTAREFNNGSKTRNVTTVKDNFSIVLTRSDSGKPSGTTQKDASSQGNQYTIILNNFGDANALLYRLGSTYYLGIDVNYYQIELIPGKVWTPLKVTNKAILEQLNP